ncbi:hypothetical protein D3C87_1629840 [compost metagenome]
MLRGNAQGTSHQQQAQAGEGLTTAQAFFARSPLQCLDREVGRHTTKIPKQHFGPLPGLGMLGAAAAPLSNGLMIGRCCGAGMQLNEPIGGFAENLRVYHRRIHQATLRQAMNAARIWRLTVISETFSRVAICA